ncbi:MAG: DUF5979 domain-containing protein [Lentihominibacter sp.]
MGRLIGKKKKSSAARFFALLLAAVLFVGTGVTASAKGSDDPQTYEDLEPDSNYIVVQKTFKGIDANQIPADFSISVGNNTLNSSNAVKNETGNVWTWKIENAEAGTYNVKENNFTIQNYDVAVDPEGVATQNGVDISVQAADINLRSNLYETKCNTLDWPISSGTLFAASLTGNQSCIVISEFPLSASQREAVNSFISTTYGRPWNTPAQFFSLDGKVEENHTFTIDGKTLTYTKNGDVAQIKISDKNVWNHLASISYSITAAQNPEIAITNTYTPKTTDVTISKSLKGNMGDVNKEFNFEMTVSGTPEGFSPEGGDGYTVEKNVYKFSLSNGETITIPDLPLGATLTIKETNASGYKVTVGETDVTNSITGDNGYSIKIPDSSDQGISIVIVNTKDVNIDTGISLTSLPYILVLMTAAAGMLAIVLRRRHSN